MIKIAAHIVCCALAAALLAACQAEVPVRGVKEKAVRVLPQDDLNAIVQRNPENTVFVLEPGIYRRQSIEPKNGQQFVGKDGAILSGAVVLKNWSKEGDFWIAKGLPDPLEPHGECLDISPGCRFREDLFVNDKVYKRVLSRAEIGPQTWYFEGHEAYLLDDPSGKRVELSVTPRAFSGKASNVQLRNLTVEKYASQAQSGAIEARRGRNWSFIDVTARWNHGIGLFVGQGTRIVNGSYSHNGQMGLGGSGGDVVIDGPEIAYNNYAGFSYGWEAGGFKFVDTQHLVVRNACVHHNNGVGMWNDIDNIDTVFEQNKVFDNFRIGIAQEISYSAKIRNNIVAHNARHRDGWLWGSQILIQNSQNVEVYGNVVEVAADYGNGIGVIHQKRGDGKYGPYVSMNNYVHDNRIIHLGVHGRSGFAVDYERDWFFTKGNNRFDDNTYVVPNREGRYWMLRDGNRDWKGVQAAKMEQDGRLVVQKLRPMKLTCDR